MAKWSAVGFQPEKSAEEQDAEGMWSIEVGALGVGRPNGWPGHLVLGNPSHRWFVDLSIRQANRPHKGIEMAPILLRMDEDFMVGDRHHWFPYKGCVLGYRVRPGVKSYTQSKDWTDRKRWNHVVGQVIRAMKGE